MKLFRYADFDFTDENWENRRIGTSRPEVLVFAEKAGWIRLLPSALTSEYTASHITSATKGERPVRLIGIVDYDPAGDIVAHSFQAQLKSAGLTRSTLTTIIHPKHYTSDEIKIFKFPLPKKEKTKLKEWLKKTGGIDGKPYGLESESMPLDRAKALIQRSIPKKS